jgi:hypothetical protein
MGTSNARILAAVILACATGCAATPRPGVAIGSTTMCRDSANLRIGCHELVAVLGQTPEQAGTVAVDRTKAERESEHLRETLERAARVKVSPNPISPPSTPVPQPVRPEVPRPRK